MLHCRSLASSAGRVLGLPLPALGSITSQLNLQDQVQYVTQMYEMLDAAQPPTSVTQEEEIQGEEYGGEHGEKDREADGDDDGNEDVENEDEGKKDEKEYEKTSEGKDVKQHESHM
ncbi:MAG: hypothetical protein SGPRY_003511, partial [Prymnesium sp.]